MPLIDWRWPRDRIRAWLAPVAVLVALAASPHGAGAAALGDRYDGYVKTLSTQKFSFGNDSNLKEAMVELAKTLVGNLPVSEEKKGLIGINIGKSIVNAYEFWDDTDAAMKKGAPAPRQEDINKFLAKMLLDNISKSDPEDMEKIAHLMHLSEESAEKLVEASSGFAKGAGEAAAHAAGGAGAEAIKTAELAIIDELCTQCAIGRQSVLVAIEAGKSLYAGVQDDIADKEYRRWLEGDPTMSFVGRGFGVVLEQARGALTAAREHQGLGPPSDADLDKFIRGKFQSFQRLEKSKRDDADLIAAVKDEFLKLSDAERAQFGANDDDRVANFAKKYLDIYKAMIGFKGDKDWPFGVGPAGFRSEVLNITKNALSITPLDLRQRIATDLRNWGWLGPVKVDGAAIAHVRERLASLSYYKMQSLFTHMGISVPNEFYGCMCSQIPHGMGVGFVFDPKRCAGDGCHFVGGYGDFCSPMPTGQASWKACQAQAGIGYKSASDRGMPIDQYIAQELAKGRR
jgi:hypothetical protein